MVLDDASNIFLFRCSAKRHTFAIVYQCALYYSYVWYSL